MVQLVKNPPAIRESWVRPLGWEDPPENGMNGMHSIETHSSILAWTISGLHSPWGRKESDKTRQL